MKLLVAIPSSDPELLKTNTLEWAPRAGFALRIFYDPKIKRSEFENMIEDANYQNYLDLKHRMLVRATERANPLQYAMDNDYDLLAILPPGLKTWNGNPQMDEMVIEFQTDLAKARRTIGEDTTIHDIKFDNGTRVVRVVKL
jgi:hypothetical protein